MPGEKWLDAKCVKNTLETLFLSNKINKEIADEVGVMWYGPNNDNGSENEIGTQYASTKSLRDKKYIFCNVHSKSHHVLCLFVRGYGKSSHKLFFIDSLGAEKLNNSQIMYVMDQLTTVGEELNKEPTTVSVSTISTRKQNNADDCGIHVIWNALAIYFNLLLPNVSNKNFEISKKTIIGATDEAINIGKEKINIDKNTVEVLRQIDNEISKSFLGGRYCCKYVPKIDTDELGKLHSIMKPYFCKSKDKKKNDHDAGYIVIVTEARAERLKNIKITYPENVKKKKEEEASDISELFKNDNGAKNQLTSPVVSVESASKNNNNDLGFASFKTAFLKHIKNNPNAANTWTIDENIKNFNIKDKADNVLVNVHTSNEKTSDEHQANKIYFTAPKATDLKVGFENIAMALKAYHQTMGSWQENGENSVVLYDIQPSGDENTKNICLNALRNVGFTPELRLSNATQQKHVDSVTTTANHQNPAVNNYAESNAAAASCNA